MGYKYFLFEVVMKWPRSVDDARAFANSNINRKLRDSIIPPCPRTIVEGKGPVLICILRDPAYPLLPFLMQEFADRGKNAQEQFFRYRLSSARRVVECAFRRLKARFCCLRRWMLICRTCLLLSIPVLSFTIFVKSIMKQ